MKRIIFCSDGTWNQPGAFETNVRKIYEHIAPEGKDANGNIIKQVKKYDKGVGATNNKAKAIFEGITGEGLDQNIRDAYEFIMEQYEDGDEIYLFGFSRGAYTARSAAGLIHNCGLLKNGSWDMLDEAFGLYRNREDHSKPGSEKMLEFKDKYSWQPHIKMLGVWDTVGALGIPLNIFQRWNMKHYSFHDVQLSKTVDNAYHALALHERRYTFRPTLWEKQETDIPQTLEQVWFSGVHSNVGGGYENTGLSDTALKWMVSKAQGLGMRFHIDPQLTPDISNGILYKSAKWFYVLAGIGWRDICKNQNANERIHRSVIKRKIEELPTALRKIYEKYLLDMEEELQYD